MNRRESIRALGITTIASGILLEACKDGEVKQALPPAADAGPGRQPFEVERDKKLKAATFFTDHEMRAITLLADIIIPADEKSVSASAAKVPEFIEFIVKDVPEHQIPMRGGLRWLDMQCFSRYNNAFADATKEQQLEIVTEIAFPLKAKEAMKPGVNFFNRMRDLTASGFFTTEIGIRDLGYVGNVATKWDGIPADVLHQYGFQEGS